MWYIIFWNITSFKFADMPELIYRKIVLDDNKDKFVDNSGSKPDYTKHELASALLSYIDSSPH